LKLVQFLHLFFSQRIRVQHHIRHVVNGFSGCPLHLLGLKIIGMVSKWAVPPQPAVEIDGREFQLDPNRDLTSIVPLDMIEETIQLCYQQGRN